MVLEFFTNKFKFRKKPVLIFFEAMILTFLSVFLSILIFPGKYMSFSVLMFLTLGSIPLFTKLFSQDSYLLNYSKPFFLRHKKIIILLFLFFLGIVLSFVIIHFFVSSSLSTHIFSMQIEELEKVNEINFSISGKFTKDPGFSGNKYFQVFSLIFKNNLLVVFAAVLLSFLYGAGGLFLIAWNASILSTVIINYLSTTIFHTPFQGIVYGSAKGLVVFLSFMPHGFFEILAYFIASIAGAILAHHLTTNTFKSIFRFQASKDIILLFLLSVGSLLLGALIEASYFI